MKAALLQSQQNLPLPRHRDFDPYDGDLDCRWAWDQFGGMTLEDAYHKFTTRPETYQEAFMFMGPRAFRYYFPILEEYLENVRAEDEFTDCSAQIIAHCIMAQLREDGKKMEDELLRRIGDLCRFVRSNLGNYALNANDRKAIGKAWAMLEDKLAQR